MSHSQNWSLLPWVLSGKCDIYLYRSYPLKMLSKVFESDTDGQLLVGN